MSRKQVECLICHKSMRADNLPRHKNTCSVPYKPETVMDKDIKQQYVGSDKIQNQQHSKTLNPKFSALIDTIINEKYEPSEKFQRKDLVEKSLANCVFELTDIKTKSVSTLLPNI